jgi:DmsE family decaheme c-type cytochrome
MRLRVWAVGTAFLLSASLLVAQNAPPPAAAPNPGFDVADCQGCHADVVFNNFQNTHHGRKLPRLCAECHGDVATHAKMMQAGEGPGPIISFKKLTNEQKTEKCMSCHDRRRQASWYGGAHDRKDLACTSCHSVHFFKSQRSQLRTATAAETCYGCHQQVRTQMMRQSHHPVREGKLDCGSCHDPHSSAVRGMLKAESVNDLCYGCHADKRGPFLWEHAPVRENCQTCHNAHGSNHEKLLVAKQPWLCQRCHMATRHPGTLYDFRNTSAGASPSNRVIEHGCRNCHNQIHGTNAPSGPYLGR